MTSTEATQCDTSTVHLIWQRVYAHTRTSLGSWLVVTWFISPVIKHITAWLMADYGSQVLAHRVCVKPASRIRQLIKNKSFIKFTHPKGSVLRIQHAKNSLRTKSAARFYFSFKNWKCVFMLELTGVRSILRSGSDRKSEWDPLTRLLGRRGFSSSAH